MTQKPEKAMAGFLNKNNYWVEASSIQVLATVLSSRMGGSYYDWMEQINLAVAAKQIKPKIVNGKAGYRTLKRKERKLLNATPPVKKGARHLVLQGAK